MDTTSNIDKNKLEREELILTQRAQKYAMRQAELGEDIKRKKITVFTLANEKYGIAVDEIKEVFLLENLTLLPATPSFLKGIVNFRGKVLPVIDLKVFFELDNKGITDLNKVIILDNHTIELGLLVDSINDVVEIDLRKVEPSLPVLTDNRAEYTIGLYKGIILLNAKQIVGDEKLIINMIS